MTRSELAKLQIRHYASPMSNWRVAPIPNVTTFVSIVDDEGAVAPEVSLDDAEQILAAHNDRAALIAENKRLRELVEKQRGLRKAAESRATSLTHAARAKTEAYRANAAESADERARLRSQLADARDADLAVAKYRKPLADILNIPWDTTSLGGVTCVRSPWIPLKTIVAAKRLVADVNPVPTRTGKAVGRRVDIDAA